MTAKRMSTYEANELLMANWQAAYREFNRKPAPPIHYENGWFIISTPGFPPSRHRRTKLFEMVRNLEAQTERRKQNETGLRNRPS